MKSLLIALAFVATAASAQVSSSSSASVSASGNGSAYSLSSSTVRNMGMPQTQAITAIQGNATAFGSAFGSNQFGTSSSISIKPMNSFGGAVAPLTVQSFRK